MCRLSSGPPRREPIAASAASTGSEQALKEEEPLTRRATLVLPLALAACAPHPQTPKFLPELVVELDNPLIEAEIAGVPMRLRVDFDRRGTIELNPAAAARLNVPFEAGPGAEVGRVHVSERVAGAPVRFGAVTVPRTLSAFARDCCAGADGAIGPDLLPYDRVRFVRSGDAGDGEIRTFPLEASSEGGLSVTTSTPAGTIAVGFSLSYPGTLATGAAGAILAGGYGGRFVGSFGEVTPAFAIPRPARTMRLARPATLAGFPVRELPVRTADFRGGLELPSDPVRPGDIVVRRRSRQQVAWPSVLIGRDRLDRCGEILFTRAPMTIRLRCRFGD